MAGRARGSITGSVMISGDGLRQIWSKGRTALGMACMMPSAFAAELLTDLGFDFIMIDCQHGLIGYDAMVPMLQSVARTGTVPLVRVPALDAAWIGSALDAGAVGVIVPMVSSLADAERAVAASHYPPEGGRSMGPVRSELLIKGSPAEVNRQVLTIALVETVGGVESAEAICSCPGVDAVMIGYIDLALSMGISPEAESAELDGAIATVLEACHKHGVAAMIGASSSERIAARVAEGYRMLLLGSDYRLLRSAAHRLLEEARSATSQG